MFAVLAACGGGEVTPDAPPPPPPPPGDHLPASIWIEQSLSQYMTWIGAVFENGADPRPPLLVIGNCLLANSSSGRYPITYDAGLITVAGTRSRTLSPTRSSEGIDYRFASSTHEFADEERINISSTGATVPPFSIALTMPATARVVRPQSTIVSRLEPLTLSWSGGSDVLLVFISFGGQWISCSFAASDGTGTIPAEVLVNMTPGPAHIAFHTQNKTVVSVPPWDVVVSADNQASWGNGQGAEFAVTVE